MQSNSIIVICLFDSTQKGILQKDDRSFYYRYWMELDLEKQIILYDIGFSAWQEFWLEHCMHQDNAIFNWNLSSSGRPYKKRHIIFHLKTSSGVGVFFCIMIMWHALFGCVTYNTSYHLQMMTWERQTGPMIPVQG